ncbi:hypothetical protein EMIT0347P_20425 [Pseudomonas sp. IT-347P]
MLVFDRNGRYSSVLMDTQIAQLFRQGDFVLFRTSEIKYKGSRIMFNLSKNKFVTFSAVPFCFSVVPFSVHGLSQFEVQPAL